MLEHPLALAIIWTAAVLYIATISLLAVYGLHSLWLLAKFLIHRRRAIPAPVAGDEVPAVLVQLPVFNERDVVERLVDAVGRLDWPRHRLRIQLLDDSTDDSAEIGARAIDALRACGLDAQQVRRPHRIGFKAGALSYGLDEDARHRDGPADYIAIFDADFVPPASFLRTAMASFLQPGAERVAFVQGRWEHLNPDANLLTRAQAMGIDGHFAIEQGARAWSGMPLNFNGTCGIWRRQAIHDGGGWQHDTLTEDMDLSYRAQLAGWTAAYRLDVAVPGELPPTLEAWRSQQFRWAKGSLQTARKLLGRIWRSEWTLEHKCSATFHMTHYLVHPLILTSLLLAPLAMFALPDLPNWCLVVGGSMMAAGMAPPILLYIASLRVLGRSWACLRALPSLAALGTGIAVSNTKAAWQALRGVVSAFVRTPKVGASATGSYRSAAATGIPELCAGLWGLVAIITATAMGSWWLSPILSMYVVGFVHHGLRLHLNRRAALVAQAASSNPAPIAQPEALPGEAEPAAT